LSADLQFDAPKLIMHSPAMGMEPRFLEKMYYASFI
jgi:hypothetical protein